MEAQSLSLQEVLLLFDSEDKKLILSCFTFGAICLGQLVV